MTYLAVALIAALVAGLGVAYALRTRTTTVNTDDLLQDWERLHEADAKLATKMPAADYLDTGLDGLR